MFWDSTPLEMGALLDALRERREGEAKAAVLRAGVVAAAIYNVNRKKGAPMVKPRDFLAEAPKALPPAALERAFDAWARDTNRRIEA